MTRAAFAPALGTGLSGDPRAGAPEQDVVRAVAAPPGTLRLHGLRIAMSRRMRHLDRDDAMRTGYRAGLDAAHHSMGAVLDMLRRGPTLDGLHALGACVIGRAADRPHAAPVAGCLCGEGVRCTALSDAGAAEGTHASLERLSPLGNVKCVAEFIGLGAAITGIAEAWRPASVTGAQRAQRAASGARDRIAGIARTARLISLNARVEAAGAGEAGRVFGVIAEVIECLSKQTEAASGKMASGVEAILAQGQWA